MEKTFGIVLIVFMAVIISLALFTQISHTIVSQKTIKASNSEKLTVVSSAWTDLTYDDIKEVQEVLNSTNETISDTYYTVATQQGQINITRPSGTYYINYTYYADDYVKSGTARNLTSIIIIILAIGIVIAGVYFGKKMGIFDL